MQRMSADGKHDLHFLASVASPSLVLLESSPDEEESAESAEEEEALLSCSLICKTVANGSQYVLYMV